MINRLKIGTCNYRPLVPKIIGNGFVYERKSHAVLKTDKYINCPHCAKYWCCIECAIEDDVLESFGQYPLSDFPLSLVCVNCEKQYDRC